MGKIRKDKGFSLAELLIVVAIVTILMGVSFVAVQNHQRSMTRLEFDTIAKEMFVAAQNHLTAAESQGYLENTDYGHEGEIIQGDDDTADVYYITSDSGTIKELMLPDYALDATVLSGSFIIRYQPSSATVLDVFYSKEGKGTFLTVSGVTLGGGDYATLMGTETIYRQGGEKNRENYKGGVIGWYGGATALPLGERLQVPTFEIINKEKLLVKVSIPSTPPVAGYCVKLIVTGKTSGAEAYFSLVYKGGEGNGPRLSADEENTIVLDSITEWDSITNKGMKFSEIEPDKTVPDKGDDFFPGEDLSIKAVAYSTDVLANVAMSAEKITNSLFADPYPYTAGKEVLGSDVENGVAGIANIRHLENLDPAISGYIPSNIKDNDEDAPNQGVQLRDLSWTEFKTNTHGEVTKIYDQKGSATNTACYYPVSPNYEIAYDGNNHKISEVNVDYSADAGIFGTLNGGSVSNLLVLDSNITSSSGNAGGLIGSMSGTEVIQCAAYGTVTSSSAAGGLIGSTSGGSVTACYSAGHTDEGSYEKWIDANTYDVTGATAGGLIGSALGTTLEDSYSTCSVSGTGTVGGFVGKADEYAEGDSITNCYAVGLVTIPKDDQNQSVNGKIGAFAGEMPETLTPSNCCYYSVINEVKRTEKRGNESVEVFDHYLGPVGDAEKDGVTELDLNAQSYEEFVGAPDTWTKAEPHDAVLKDYYRGYDESSKKYYPVYNLKGISRLSGAAGTQLDDDTDEDEPIVYTHYGDWPAPEIFVIN